jgi:hypothetical protein
VAIARLESDVAHVRSDISDMKIDIRELRHECTAIKGGVASLHTEMLKGGSPA